MKIGKISTNALKRSVLGSINTRREEVVNGAGIGEDCAILTFPDKAMTVSCVQEAALVMGKAAMAVPEATVTTRDAKTRQASTVATGKNDVQVLKAQTEEDKKYSAEQRTITQLIQKCANNLAAKGAEPVAALITLLLPESLEEPDLKGFMTEAEKACEDLHMQIAGGQTRVTKAVTVPYGIVTGIGEVQAKTYESLKTAAPGQDVVISKWIGLEGTAYLAEQYKETLLERYPAWLVEKAASFDRYLSVIPEAATAMKSGVCAMHDVSEGGILGALWELAEGAGVGLTIDFKKLPLRQETVEVCECCNVNPYELMSGGCLLMTSEDGSELVSALEAEGIPAVMVGKVTDSNDRILLNEDEIRYLDRPKRDQIYGVSKI